MEEISDLEDNQPPVPTWGLRVAMVLFTPLFRVSDVIIWAFRMRPNGPRVMDTSCGWFHPDRATRPKFDAAGERIVYDNEGRRVIAFAQREFTVWDNLRLLALLPVLPLYMCWKMALWQRYDGMRFDAPDFSPFRGTGPYYPEVAEFIAQEEAAEHEEAAEQEEKLAC